MRRTIALRTILVVVVIAIAGGALTSRVLSAAQPTPSSDVLTTLLSEVKGLRVAIEQMSSGSARIQLAVARLQIEEQRINDAGKRLQDLRQRLGDARRELQDTESRAAEMEKALAGNPSEGLRNSLTFELTQLNRSAALRRATISELSAEEAQLTQDVAAEQARWIEISRRLDELDASMAIRK
jgi:predicted  nucleic acid-binding Zn-ribbon protein